MRELLRDQSGANAIDYSLLAGLIAVVLIGAVTAIGADVNDVFQAIVGALAGTGKV